MNSIVGSQSYPWTQYLEEAGTTYGPQHYDDIFKALQECGIAAYEGVVTSREQAAAMQKAAQKYNVVMPSVYYNVLLHTANWKQEVESAVNHAKIAASLGTKVVVVNPTPIRWGANDAKSDDELKTQATALQTLGERLNGEGLKLAYHTHDPEMQNAAREFHHMLLSTNPQHVGLCLDSHWIYRGAGNSQVALYDIVKLYGERIVSLHIRQSHKGIWSEVLEDGDIDYRPLATWLKERNFSGPLIIEQARERGTPQTMPSVERLRRSRAWVRETFGV
jgi:inosose dehydratase